MATDAITLNQRRQAILRLLVHDYIRTAAPVASQQIVKRHSLKVSPATIRNDMAELEERGFIVRPHTSAGGVPADRGYRFYVERSTEAAQPSPAFERRVRSEMAHLDAADFEGAARTAATVLSGALHNVAVAAPPGLRDARIKQLHLVHLYGSHVLLVLVLHEGHVLQHTIHGPDDVTPEELAQLSSLLTDSLRGAATDDVQAVWASQRGTNEFADAAVDETSRVMRVHATSAVEHPFVAGLRHMLSQPEFVEGSHAREAVAVLEDEATLRDLVAEQLRPGEVRVIIGSENANKHLHPYSLVLSRYGGTGSESGAVAVIGPTRMDYATAIASVRLLADVMGELALALDESGA